MMRPKMLTMNFSVLRFSLTQNLFLRPNELSSMTAQKVPKMN